MRDVPERWRGAQSRSWLLEALERGASPCVTFPTRAVTGERNFDLLEMNTRLQVEHPVAWQRHVAQGGVQSLLERWRACHSPAEERADA